MLAKDFITKDIPVLKSFDKVEYALTLMDDFKLRQLPVVEKEIYQGVISERELHAFPDFSVVIGKPILFAPYVHENGYLHEILALMTRYKLTLLPVVTPDGTYSGAITREAFIDILSEFTNAEEKGSVIVLELTGQDYSLSEIVRIVESNNAHIVNLFSRMDQTTGRLRLIMKVNLEDASPMIRSFERFDYTVLFHFMEKGMVDELLQQRMNELLYYMNL